MSEQSHILLVEDSRTQALEMAGVLQQAGWSVTHAASTEQAMELLNHESFDLILVDYYLPGMRGDVLCRQIRRGIDTRVIPIVILTGDSGQEVEVRGLDSGADDFITKSADHQLLLLKLRNLLAKKSDAGKTAAPTETDFKNARLLAVDDSRTYLAYLVNELQGESYQVETSFGGPDAIARIANEHFDCVLVDLVMPNMDGIEVCKRISAIHPASGQAPMVLMLTGQEDNQSLARALEAGADDFVGKSSDIIVIKGRIRALLRRKFYEEEHHRRLSAELRAKELEAEHARVKQEAAEVRFAMVDDLERTATALRRSNQELHQFAYVASHDLQEPLRAIAGYMTLLERRYKEQLDDQGKEFIRFAVDGAIRMKALISDLLAFSRVETKGDAFEPVDMKRVLDSAVANLHTAINESGATITHDPLPVVPCDRTQLIQLLQNLIGNAIKYRGKESPRIHIGVTGQEREITFWVRDNGIGINPQYFERIFVIFQRLHAAAEYPGTGIGLSIAKRIVERHHGRIWVESQPGQGATFYFTIAMRHSALLSEQPPKGAVINPPPVESRAA